jgi:hypothetical protein
MSLRLSVILALVALCLFAAAGYAGAANFAVLAEPGADATTWIYTLFNNSSPAAALVVTGLDLDWPEGVERPAFTVVQGTPDGWTALDYPWPAWDASTTNEPSAGNNLPGFTVITNDLPTHFVVYFDNLGIPDYEEGEVEVQSTPEPGSLIAMLSGFAGLACAARRRRA